MTQLAFYYFAWHYSTGLRDYMRNWTNIIWFFWHFFSIGLLFKTFFAPFHRIREENRKPGIHIEEFFQNILVNILMRIVGIVLRTIIIAIGLISIIAMLVFGTIFFIVWFFMPVVLFGLLLAGVLFFVS